MSFARSFSGSHWLFFGACCRWLEVDGSLDWCWWQHRFVPGAALILCQGWLLMVRLIWRVLLRRLCWLWLTRLEGDRGWKFVIYILFIAAAILRGISRVFHSEEIGRWFVLKCL